MFILSGGLTSAYKLIGREDLEEFVFVEAEQFAHKGGWELDQQLMDQMGSSYLLAHGLGIPVKDAHTSVEFPSKGKYRVWVRTRDWVAPWNAPGAPGKFQLLINGNPVNEIFGTKGAKWHWHDGGIVEVSKTSTIVLHDLTGFEGRCDSILFCKDPNFVPNNDLEALTKFRRHLLGLPENPENGGHFDFVVVGGGFAGTCAALSAARNGLKVALVQDRPLLGGNGSSEVRVWPEGKIQQEPFPNIGNVVAEIAPDPAKSKYRSRNALDGAAYCDEKKLDAVRKEPNITLFLNERAIKVESNNSTIEAVIIQNTITAMHTRLKAHYYADCTGDANVGFLAGADFELSNTTFMGMSNLWNTMDASSEKEVLNCECKDKNALSLAFKIGKTEQPFPRCLWAIDLSDKPFPGRDKLKGQWGTEDQLGNLGTWFWESGFDKDPINDLELIRDNNFRAMYGAWDVLKNVDKQFPNHRIGWAAYIAGKRESRRLIGDIVLSADDFKTQKKFSDPAFPCSWHIDVHNPDKMFDSGLEGQEFISKATAGEGYSYDGIYWAPYRVLYSRNINNLFMAGRNISVTREGLGPVRVMKTCGMMGEVVGKAASICINKNTSPRGVYKFYLNELQNLMNKNE